MRYVGDLWATGDETILVSKQVYVEAETTAQARRRIIDEKWDSRLDIVGMSPLVLGLRRVAPVLIE